MAFEGLFFELLEVFESDSHVYAVVAHEVDAVVWSRGHGEFGVQFVGEGVLLLSNALVVGNCDGVGSLFCVGSDRPIEDFSDDVLGFFFGEVGVVERKLDHFFNEVFGAVTQFLFGGASDVID